jgi:hypothetical protein
MKERDHAGKNKSESRPAQDEQAEKKASSFLKRSRLQGRAATESQEMIKPRRKAIRVVANMKQRNSRDQKTTE